MTEQEILDRLRRMTGETEDQGYSDAQLTKILEESSGSLNAAAATIWGEKASDYADLVNITEAGSSRSNSDLFKHAKEQAAHFTAISDSEGGEATPVYSTTRRIERF